MRNTWDAEDTVKETLNQLGLGNGKITTQKALIPFTWCRYVVFAGSPRTLHYYYKLSYPESANTLEKRTK